MTVLRYLLTLLAITVPLSQSPAAEWEMDKATSRLEFIVQAQNNSLRGSFKEFDAQIELDPHNVDAGQIEITVDTGSITTGEDQADSLARSADWLGTEMFPKAQFQSTHIVITGTNTYTATGLLTIKQLSMPVDLAFTLTIEGLMAMATGSTTLTRSAFEIGAPYSDNLPIADQVRIEFTIKAYDR